MAGLNFLTWLGVDLQPGRRVFDVIHNIQGNAPLENVGAIFKAMRESHP